MHSHTQASFLSKPTMAGSCCLVTGFCQHEERKKSSNWCFPSSLNNFHWQLSIEAENLFSVMEEGFGEDGFSLFVTSSEPSLAQRRSGREDVGSSQTMGLQVSHSEEKKRSEPPWGSVMPLISWKCLLHPLVSYKCYIEMWGKQQLTSSLASP